MNEEPETQETATAVQDAAAALPSLAPITDDVAATGSPAEVDPEPCYDDLRPAGEYVEGRAQRAGVPPLNFRDYGEVIGTMRLLAAIEGHLAAIRAALEHRAA